MRSTRESFSYFLAQIDASRPWSMVRAKAIPAGLSGGKTIYDPWHYMPVLARKRRALRNGALFRDWVLPGDRERAE
jgi:hypothetical protein